MWKKAHHWRRLVVFSAVMLVAVPSLWLPDWIELCFGLDPDLGNGMVEGLIMALGGGAAIIAFAMAGMKWRRIHVVRTVGETT